jgi:replicative DNA helicase
VLGPDDAGNMPPHDKRAEQVTLGSMMISATALARIEGILTAGDHFVPAHQIVHEAIGRLCERGEPAEVVAVAMELERTGEITRAGGALYLHELVAAVAVAENGPYYAQRVAEHARTRRAQQGLTRALQITSSPGFSPAEDMDRVRQAVDEATGQDAATGTAAWLADAVRDTVDALERPLPSDQVVPPYADLRGIVLALRPGQLITVAARPSIGKTLVVGDFARHAALKLGLPVAWFSLEMSRDEIILRTIAAHARVDLERLQLRTLSEPEWDRVMLAAKEFGESHVLIDDKCGSNLAHVRSSLRAMSRVVTPHLVVFDYLQLGTSPGAPSRQEEVSRLARGFKDIAGEFGVPVLQAAQLNRNPESRHDKRPLQSDLRESGEIENSSDVVILLHREDYYEPESPRAGEMDLIVTKNRNGRTGQCTVSFQGRFCRCVDLSPEVPPPYWGSDS